MAMRLIGRRICSSFLGGSLSADSFALAPRGVRHFQKVPEYDAKLPIEPASWEDAAFAFVISGACYWFDLVGIRSQVEHGLELRRISAEIEDEVKKKNGV